MDFSQAPKVTHATDLLESTGKTGKRIFWQGFVAEKEGSVYHYTVSYSELSPGLYSKNLRSEETDVSGKNLGRSNETSPHDQAIAEIEAKARKKRDVGFHMEDEDTGPRLPLPMLAHTYFDNGKTKGHRAKIKWPCFASAKLDGYRMVFDGKTGWTRKGKFYKDEVVSHLQFDTNGLILDGELMLPPDVEFEKLKTATSNFVPGLTDKLMYYVFDVIPEEGDDQLSGVDAPYSERYAVLEELFETVSVPENVYLLPSVKCSGPEDAEERLGKAITRGYEGLILRNMDGKYDVGHRSYDLQKLKLFHDSEFEITDCVDGKGSDSEAIIYVCKVKSGDTFTVRPKQSIKERKRLWYEFCCGTYDPMGQMLTVEYFELTAKGMPRFPKGKGIREDA